ncbi:hypothetical protein KAU11_03830, partial [Candidatus Babeliales bacterium]|nr:hypothetical protein [Candidatus Babeliales bacterium]
MNLRFLLVLFAGLLLPKPIKPIIVKISAAYHPVLKKLVYFLHDIHEEIDCMMEYGFLQWTAVQAAHKGFPQKRILIETLDKSLEFIRNIEANELLYDKDLIKECDHRDLKNGVLLRSIFKSNKDSEDIDCLRVNCSYLITLIHKRSLSCEKVRDLKKIKEILTQIVEKDENFLNVKKHKVNLDKFFKVCERVSLHEPKPEWLDMFNKNFNKILEVEFGLNGTIFRDILFSFQRKTTLNLTDSINNVNKAAEMRLNQKSKRDDGLYNFNTAMNFEILSRIVNSPNADKRFFVYAGSAHCDAVISYMKDLKFKVKELVKDEKFFAECKEFGLQLAAIGMVGIT